MACKGTPRIFLNQKAPRNPPIFMIRIKFELTTQNYTNVLEMKDDAQPNYFSSRRKPLARRGFCQEEEPRKGEQSRKANVGSRSW